MTRDTMRLQPIQGPVFLPCVPGGPCSNEATSCAGVGQEGGCWKQIVWAFSRKPEGRSQDKPLQSRGVVSNCSWMRRCPLTDLQEPGRPTSACDFDMYERNKEHGRGEKTTHPKGASICLCNYRQSSPSIVCFPSSVLNKY